MSAFSLYVVGFWALLAGLAYAAYLLGVPTHWIGVGTLVMIGLGTMSAVSRTKERDPPKEALAIAAAEPPQANPPAQN